MLMSLSLPVDPPASAGSCVCSTGGALPRRAFSVAIRCRRSALSSGAVAAAANNSAGADEAAPADEFGMPQPSAAERKAAIESSVIYGHYEEIIDRESAFEKLRGGAAPAGNGAGAAPAPAPQASPAAVASWQSRLFAHLERNKRYPAAARARGIQGMLKFRFTIDPAGNVLNVQILQSSGQPPVLIDSSAER